MIRVSIDRPTSVIMVLAALSLLGGMAWVTLPLEYLPDTRLPRLTLEVDWPGSSPETLEARVTAPLESALRGGRGVRRITSSTVEGRAILDVEFSPGTPMDFARLELSERLAAEEENLPLGVRSVRLRPFLPAEVERAMTRPFLLYTLSGPVSTEVLAHFVEATLRPELQQVPGVTSVEVHGGGSRRLVVELHRERTASLGLSAERIAGEIEARGRGLDAGSVVWRGREWGLAVRPVPPVIGDLRALRLPVRGQVPVQLGEISEVRDTFEEPPFVLRRNGHPAVAFTVHREPNTDALRVARGVQERIKTLDFARPPGTELSLDEDLSVDLRRHLDALRDRAGVSLAGTVIVLRLFLGSFRPVGVLLATVGVSLLTTFFLMAWVGIRLNLLTLMGLALGLGMIVDNAIVVLENILRRIRGGDSPGQAAERGAREVVFPVWASTLTTGMAFVPFLYLQGELRTFYLPMVLGVGAALVSSLFVAFTLIPSRAAQASWPGGSERRAVSFSRGMVERSLGFPKSTVLASLVLLGVSGALFQTSVRRGGAWSGEAEEDRSSLRIQIVLPRGAALPHVDQLTRAFEDQLRGRPEVERFTVQMGGTQSYTVVEFPQSMEFTPLPRALEEQLRAFALGFTGAEVRVFGQGPAFSGAVGRPPPPYRVTLLGYHYPRLAELAEDLGRRLARHPRIELVDAQASSGFVQGDRAIEVVAEVNREAAARYGFSVAEVERGVFEALPGGGARGEVPLGGERIPFEVRFEGTREVDRGTLLQIGVGGSRGPPVPLGEWIHLGERRLPSVIRREEQQYERTVTWEFRGPPRMGDGVRDAALAATDLPSGYQILDRTAGRMSDADRRQLAGVFVISLSLIFFATAGLFESLRQPLCVLLSVPLGWIGVFWVFVGVDAIFTREAWVGMILLGGIGVNNAILLVDHINRVRREREGGLEEAIVRATQERARPIAMTTATTVGGILPLILFSGSPDAAPWNGLAYVLVGGLMASTGATLTVTPALYLLLERGRRPRNQPATAPSSSGGN